MIVRLVTLAANEVRMGYRNRWIILAVVILTLFALVLTAVGSAPAGDVRADRLAVVVASLATLSVYLVPLIALLLAFDAIAGEIDRGTMQLLLVCPVARWEIVAGKFLGHLSVLAIALVIGYGTAGAVILTSGGGSAAGLVNLARLVATSLLLGATFLGLGYLVSALSRQTGTAAALAVGAWLVAVVLYDLGLLGALVADDGGFFTQKLFPYLLAANPGDAFRLYNLAALESGPTLSGMAGIAAALPFPPAVGLVSLALWVVATTAVATFIFRRLEP